MSDNANDANIVPGAPLGGVDEGLHDANVNALIDTQVTDIVINHGVLYWSDAKFNIRYTDTVDARRFGEIFSDGANLFMFNRWNVLRDRDVGL